MNSHKVIKALIFTLMAIDFLCLSTSAQNPPIQRETTTQIVDISSCEPMADELRSLNERSQKLAAGVSEKESAKDRIKTIGGLLSGWDELVTELRVNDVSKNKNLAEIKGLAPLKRRNLIGDLRMPYRSAWDNETLDFAKAVRSGLLGMYGRFKKNPRGIVTLPEQRAEVEINIILASYRARRENCNVGGGGTDRATGGPAMPAPDFNSVTLRDAKPSSRFCELRYREVEYTTVCQQQTEMGVPSDVYYYRTPGVTKVAGVNNGELLWNRFVRTPAVGYKYQTEGTWMHIYWMQENGKWIRKVESHVAVEFIGVVAQ